MGERDIRAEPSGVELQWLFFAVFVDYLGGGASGLRVEIRIWM